jgi:hypothetical protein
LEDQRGVRDFMARCEEAQGAQAQTVDAGNITDRQIISLNTSHVGREGAAFGSGESGPAAVLEVHWKPHNQKRASQLLREVKTELQRLRLSPESVAFAIRDCALP